MVDLNALKELHDIHLPQPIGLWPLAWGWWVVIAFFLSIIFLAHRYLFLMVNYRRKKTLLKELNRIEKKYNETRNAGQSINELAFFLKKAALVFYPREQVGSLYGDAWLQFLTATSKNLDTTNCEKLFTESLYQEEPKEDVSKAFIMAKQWLVNQRLSCMN